MKRTSKSKSLSGVAKTIYLVNQEAQSTAFLEVNVKGFLKKDGEKINRNLKSQIKQGLEIPRDY